jgi:hypothetical protein
MILAPTSGPIGIQPHGSTARMISRDGTNTLAVGTVVISSYGHSGVVYPPTTAAESELSVFAGVVMAEGDVATHNGFIGVVVDLLDGAGANGTYVMVQFGGPVKAKTTASAAISRGTPLGLHDSNGGFDTGGAGTSIYPCAVALQTLASGTDTIWVLTTPTVYFRADV